MLNKEHKGLSSTEAEKRLQQYGLNDIVEKKRNVIKKFLAPLYSPISLMLLGAAILSYFDGKIFDCYFILVLYFVNYSIQKIQEFKADRAIKELRDKLLLEVRVFRDNKWSTINSKYLVKGDYIAIGLGSIIPADARVVFTENLSVNEAVLTGESFPKNKKEGDEIYSSSFISTGDLEAEITATGINTNFGRTLFSIDQSTEKSILEKDILSITKFLTSISIVAVIILTTVFLYRGFLFEDILTLDLSLIIAGIPIALPAVMTIILSIGAGELAKKSVIVRRLSALQDLANVNLLLTDKTGTLTKNEIKITNVISYQEGLSTNDIIEFASYTTSQKTPDTIGLAIIKKFEELRKDKSEIDIINSIPYDSDRKRSTVFIKKDNEKILISVGAPQVIKSLDEFNSKEVSDKFEKDISEAAQKGFRVLAVAIKKGDSEEKNMSIIGILFLTDPLYDDSKETLLFMKENGIDVKILTGDNKVIAERITRELGLVGEVFLTTEETRKLYENKTTFQNELNDISTFAEISPKDKYEIVKQFKINNIVASTGDGINDLPALKVANVSIAVSNAVSALKGMADIVLLGQGISVIKDAILESRKIFTRLYNYSIYRISESFRLIITILIIGLIYGFYPLQPLQLILLAFLNDIPIISLVVDRVKISTKPSQINVKERSILSLLFGSVGVLNSILLFIFMTHVLSLPLAVIQTIFFLKLTVSGHALIFVAHTKERWYKFLPSKQVIIATIATQLIATTLAVTGFLMPTSISLTTAIAVWVWALFWMQISELMKDVQIRLLR